MIRSSELSLIALDNIHGRPPVPTPSPTYTWPIRNRVRTADASEFVDTLSYAGPPPTSLSNLLMGVPAYTDPGEPRDDRGVLQTEVDTSDSWGVNCLLSQLPSYFRRIDKRLGVSSHFPASGMLELTPTIPVSANRLQAMRELVDLASVDRRYLLFDANLPRYSGDGHRYPKSWLWDVYDEIAMRLDAKASGDEEDTYHGESCIQVSDGRIYYGKNDVGEAYDLHHNLVDLSFVSTDVTDEYITRVRELLQQAYDEGWCHFSSSVPVTFVPISSRLHAPREPMYPSAVELYYN